MPRACWGSQSRSGRSHRRLFRFTLQFRRPQQQGPRRVAAPRRAGSLKPGCTGRTRTIIEEHRARGREAQTLSCLSTEIAHLRNRTGCLATTVRRHEEELRRLLSFFTFAVSLQRSDLRGSEKVKSHLAEFFSFSLSARVHGNWWISNARRSRYSTQSGLAIRL